MAFPKEEFDLLEGFSLARFQVASIGIEETIYLLLSGAHILYVSFPPQPGSVSHHAL